MLSLNRINDLQTSIGAATDGLLVAIQMSIKKIQHYEARDDHTSLGIYLDELDRQVDLLNATLHMEKNLDSDDSEYREYPCEKTYS